MSKQTPLLINFKWQEIKFIIEVPAFILENFITYALDVVMDEELLFRFAQVKMTNSIFLALRNIYPQISLDAVTTNLESNLFKQAIQLPLDCLYGNQVVLCAYNLEQLQALFEKYQFKFAVLKLPKLSKIVGNLSIEVNKPFKHTYTLGACESICSQTNGIYLKLQFEIYGIRQIIYLSKNIIKYIYTLFELEISFSYNEQNTNFTLGHVNYFLDVLFNTKVVLLTWSYTQLKPQSYYQFLIKGCGLNGDILCSTIFYEIQELFSTSMQSNTESDYLDLETKILTIPVVAAETYLKLEELKNLNTGDVILLNSVELNANLGETQLLLLPLIDNETMLKINRVA